MATSEGTAGAQELERQEGPSARAFERTWLSRTGREYTLVVLHASACGPLVQGADAYSVGIPGDHHQTLSSMETGIVSFSLHSASRRKSSTQEALVNILDKRK